jgi:hypothetical protein
MMDDATLKNLLMADVPASDPPFALVVMKHIEQRRFLRELAQTTGLAAFAGALLWLLAPMIEAAWQENFATSSSNLVILLALMGVSIFVPYLYRNEINQLL